MKLYHALLLLISQPALATDAAQKLPTPAEIRQSVLKTAARLLDEAKISYVYGGFQVGDGDDCKLCNDCLSEKKPEPRARLKLCAVCGRCSLDCSHFAALLYKEAGAPYPYLDTKGMLESSKATLAKSYGLSVIEEISRVQAGDLLVYEGHVVVLERPHDAVPGLPRYRGDIVHATGGKDVKGAGEGIQRERFVDIESFRGPLKRVLRVAAMAQKPKGIEETPAARAPVKLRPVEKRKKDH